VWHMDESEADGRPSSNFSRRRTSNRGRETGPLVLFWSSSPPSFSRSLRFSSAHPIHSVRPAPSSRIRSLRGPPIGYQPASRPCHFSRSVRDPRDTSPPSVEHTDPPPRCAPLHGVAGCCSALPIALSIFSRDDFLATSSDCAARTALHSAGSEHSGGQGKVVRIYTRNIASQLRLLLAVDRRDSNGVDFSATF
jgi:hypothetical protein